MLLVQLYVGRIKAAGGEVVARVAVARLVRGDRRWRIACKGGRQFAASALVDAAGAWADEIAGHAGARPLGLAPMRRSAVTFDAPPRTDLAALSMAVDADERVHLKPEGAALMASPGDETPDPLGDSRPEEIDIAICLNRIAQAFDVDVRRPRATWSGLCTFAPDRAPVCGWDPDVPGFYWLAGQGGSGVRTAPALARLAADDLLGATARRGPKSPVCGAKHLTRGASNSRGEQRATESDDMIKGTIAAFAALALGPGPARAQWEPEGPIALWIGLGTGGETDKLGRLLAEEMSEATGWDFVVENTPGGGRAKFPQLAAAKRDGQTLGTGATMPVLVNLTVRPDEAPFALDNFD